MRRFCSRFKNSQQKDKTMAIKCVTQPSKPRNEKSYYPRLKELTKPLGSGGRGAVVLFTAEKTGVVVVSAGLQPTGYYSTSWSEEQCFDDFTGTLTLEND